MDINRDDDQPEPVECVVDTYGGVTAIARLWRVGDAARCRLCPVCGARANMCLVQTNREVREEDMWLFAMRGPPSRPMAHGTLRLAQ
jgi:hypothetical protein